MIQPDLTLLELEVGFKTSRSGGAGGQHVNKVSTKVELNFDVVNSKVLDEEQKSIILLNLKNKISADGILQIISQETRSQLKNKEDAVKKFKELIKDAFFVQKKRKPTKIPKSVKEKRLNDKKRNSENKKFRSGSF